MGDSIKSYDIKYYKGLGTSTEKEAKEHLSNEQKESHEKDALQVRVLYGNGNSLKSTAKFAVFDQWRKLFNVNPSIEV